MTLRRWASAVLVLGVFCLPACGSEQTTTSATADASTTTPAVSVPPSTSSGDELPPASVDVVIAPTAERVSGVIGPAGGVLTAVQDGVTYTLTIPDRALLADVQVTMTPIATLEGDVVGGAAVAGVVLEPSGLLLVVPATLEVLGSDLDDTVGFAAQDGGEDFHLTLSDDRSVALSSFSVHGLADAVLTQLAETYQPQSTATDASHQLAIALEQENAALAVEILTMWAGDINTRIVDLPNRGLGFQDQVAAEAILYLNISQHVSRTLDFTTEQTEAIQGAAIFTVWEPIWRWIREEFDRLSAACAAEERPEYALLALRWSIILEKGLTPPLPYDPQVDPGTSQGWGVIDECTGGEITYRANVVGRSVDDVVGSISYEASAEIPVEFDLLSDDAIRIYDDGSALLKTPFLEGPWELTDFDVEGEDIRCLDAEYRPGTAKAAVAWANVDLNLGRYDDADLPPPVVVIQISEPFSIKCQGLELAHLGHNQLVIANAERVEGSSRGYFEFATSYDALTTNFVTASTGQERGDLFGAQWEIQQSVGWSLGE